jgi:hypothetical protein
MLFLRVIKLKNIGKYLKVFSLILFFIVCSSFRGPNFSTIYTDYCHYKHPFYMGVIDIKYDSKTQHVAVSIKLFTNDIEDALKKTTTKSIDLLNPTNKANMEFELFEYIKKRFSVELNNKITTLDFIGYEKEEDAIWTYLEIKKSNQPHRLKIITSLLYDFLPQQMLIIHAEVNSLKKSFKLTNPENQVEFNF